MRVFSPPTDFFFPNNLFSLSPSFALVSPSIILSLDSSSSSRFCRFVCVSLVSSFLKSRFLTHDRHDTSSPFLVFVPIHQPAREMHVSWGIVTFSNFISPLSSLPSSPTHPVFSLSLCSKSKCRISSHFLPINNPSFSTTSPVFVVGGWIRKRYSYTPSFSPPLVERRKKAPPPPPHLFFVVESIITQNEKVVPGVVLAFRDAGIACSESKQERASVCRLFCFSREAMPGLTRNPRMHDP